MAYLLRKYITVYYNQWFFNSYIPYIHIMKCVYKSTCIMI